MPGAGASGLGMPGLQGTGLDATPEKSFVKMSTDPATLHQAFHYADIAATEPYASDGKHLLFNRTPLPLIFLTSHGMSGMWPMLSLGISSPAPRATISGGVS